MEEGSISGRHYNPNECLLLQCADVILPWLTPQELANISITCKSLNKLSHSITLLRSSDASRTLENFPVPFLNNTLDNRPYSYFLYTPSLLSLSRLPLRQPWGSSSATTTTRLPRIPNAESVTLVDESGRAVSGCDCEDSCRDEWCLCLGLDGMDDVGRECGLGCCCGMECGNRLSGNGVAVRVKIVRNGRKGWGLFADQFITKGQFLFEYAGELLTTKEAQRRQRQYDELSSNDGFSFALLVVREHLPSGKSCLRLNIDATRIGNVARFVNHSCDGGNLSSKLVRTSGALLRSIQNINLTGHRCELLTTKEAQRRLRLYDELASNGGFSFAFLVVREHLPSGKACLRLNIDATRIGNVARFVNHSCDGGNLSSKLVRTSGALFPRLCFFAYRDIKEEELTFSYGEIRKKANGLPCYCNSPSCFGTLPSEDT